MHAGHSGKFVSKERFIPVHHISTKLGKAACKSYQPCMLCQDETRQVVYTDLESERHIQL